MDTAPPAKSVAGWGDIDISQFETTAEQFLQSIPGKPQDDALAAIKCEGGRDLSSPRSSGDFHASPDTEDWQPDSKGAALGSRTKRKGAATVSADVAKMSNAQRRTLELQEKNRRAQRRFRERQKAKVSELEDNVAELTAKLQELSQDKAALDSRVGILNRVLRMREEHIDMLQRKAKDSSEAVGDDAEGLHLTDTNGQPRDLTAQQIKDLARPELVEIWKGYVNQMAVTLVEADAGSSPQATAKLQRLVHELCDLIMKIHMLNPDGAREFTSQKIDQSAEMAGDVETAERWLSLARALCLSQKQRLEIVQLRRLFLSKMNAIVQQRREIHQTLMSAMPAPSFSRATAIQGMRTQDSIERLRANLKEEHLLKMDWIMTLFKYTLTAAQVCRSIVQAWPYSPDTLAMAAWIAAEQNEPDAVAALTQATQAPAQPVMPMRSASQHSGSPSTGPSPQQAPVQQQQQQQQQQHMQSQQPQQQMHHPQQQPMQQQQAQAPIISSAAIASMPLFSGAEPDPMFVGDNGGGFGGVPSGWGSIASFDVVGGGGGGMPPTDVSGLPPMDSGMSAIGCGPGGGPAFDLSTAMPPSQMHFGVGSLPQGAPMGSQAGDGSYAAAPSPYFAGQPYQ